MKYLIGSTPNGMIMCIPEGYDGSLSDLKIVKESKFLNTVYCQNNVVEWQIEDLKELIQCYIH